MHSTVQTGLYTPNIFNYEYNNYHPNPSAHTNTCHHFPPPPVSLHHPHNHCANPSPGHLHKHKKTHEHGGCSSVYASLLAINTDDSHADNKTTLKPALSATNLNKTSAYLSLSSNNLNLDKTNKKVPKSSTFDGQLSKSNSAHAINMTGLIDKPMVHHHSQLLNASASHLAESQIIRKPTSLSNLKTEIKNFWSCSIPCGILTLILSVLLILSSFIGFLLLFEESLCNMALTCSNPLIKLASVSFLVIGVVLAFFGFVIVIYTKKDRDADIIITTEKRLDKIQLDVQKQQNEHHKKSARNGVDGAVCSSSKLELSHSRSGEFRKINDNVADTKVASIHNEDSPSIPLLNSSNECQSMKESNHTKQKIPTIDNKEAQLGKIDSSNNKLNQNVEIRINSNEYLASN